MNSSAEQTPTGKKPAETDNTSAPENQASEMTIVLQNVPDPEENRKKKQRDAKKKEQHGDDESKQKVVIDSESLISIVEDFRKKMDYIQQRLQGNYQTDPYGMDSELVEMARPLLLFMYKKWWRVKTNGIVHIPETGRALLVSNHSGVIPWDGAMIATAVHEEHPQARIVRNLFMHWFSTLPFVGSTLTRAGSIPGTPENALHLLQQDELVCTFPEGAKGVGKLFRDRYKLARFGRGGFIQVALRTASPIIPVAVVGAEEIYPMMANAKPIAQWLKVPYFPITPIFPFLGPLGTIPLPSRWSITFCPPIPTDGYKPDDADDPLVVFTLAEQVRTTIQQTLDAQVAQRGSLF